MFNACKPFRGRLAWLIAAGFLVGSVAKGQPYEPMQRGPLARLVKTPEEATGMPPFALADQSGTIQRYVEPVPGIDLEAYVNQVVTVRHDTGETLLASQLELAQPAFYPMVGESYGKAPSEFNARLASSSGGRASEDGDVEQAEFVDNDDATVELLEEGQSLPNGGPMIQGAVPEGAIYPDGTPVYPGPMSPGMPIMNSGPMYYDPMQGGQMMGPYPGGYPREPAMGPNMGFVQPYRQQPERERPHVYADVEINFLRAHVMEETFGKLSEKYEFSPRFIVGFADLGGLSGRVRYWIYGRGTDGLSDDDDIHLDIDVLDVEATHLIAGKRSQVELAAGFRMAGIEIEDADEEACGTDLLGITMAADGWTPLFCSKQGGVGLAYGGRLSVLAGDWAGEDDNDFVNERIRDDNVVVHELYAGIGFTRRLRRIDLNALVDFEMQNWHSDVLSEATDGSLGFVGPGIRIGAEF